MDKTRAMIGSALRFDFKLRAASRIAGSGHRKLTGEIIQPPHKHITANMMAMIADAKVQFEYLGESLVIYYLLFGRIRLLF